jgi:hypothetical protein
VDTSYCGDRLLGVSIAIAVVQIVVVPARFYTRYIQHVTCTLDDYLIIPALVGRYLLEPVMSCAKKCGCADCKPGAIGVIYRMYVSDILSDMPESGGD